MTPDQARELGASLRAARTAKGMTGSQVAAIANTDVTTVSRIERGDIASPAPDKLRKIAEAVGLSSSEVFLQAGYASVEDLPLAIYLRARYDGELTDEDIKAVERLVSKRSGRSTGPSNREDEN